MLGSLPEADEAVQDAWLRLSRAGAEGVENLGGWSTTIVARVCLNVLQARQARPEHPAGLRMPDPVVRRPVEIIDLGMEIGGSSRRLLVQHGRSG